MKRILAAIAGVLLLVVVVLAGVLLYARSHTLARYAALHDVDVDPIPVPWPLTDEERKALVPPPEGEDTDGGEAPDFDAIALARAIERGERLAEVRLGCSECHGPDYGGHVIADVPGVFTFVAPNLTAGRGGRTEISTEDWVRILRHGINPDGTTSAMPAIDYTQLSDRELSDVMAYVRSKPPVDREMAKTSYGPALWMAFTFGGKKFPVEVIDHGAERPSLPPEEGVDLAFGEHLAKVCVGCHGMHYSGGPMADGDPAWPDAANLTPDPDGLGTWSRDDFFRAMRDGLRPDGTAIDPSMPVQMTSKMSDTELDALWLYFSQLPARPTGT